MRTHMSPEPVRDVKRILVLRPNAVGDFVMALPALHALRACYPHAEIVYLGKQWHADFLRDRPGPIDRVEVVPACPGVGAAPDTQVDVNAVDRCVGHISAMEPDIALQAYGGGAYSNPFLLRLGARLSIGLKAPFAPPLDRWVSFGTLQNRRLQLLEVTALAGANRLHLGPELQVTAHDRREAQQVLKGLDCDARPRVVLHPASSDRRRCWSPENFSRLGDALCEAGAQVAINGTATETDLVRAVMNGMRHRAALSARTHCPVCGAENLRTRCAHEASFVDDVRFEEVHALAMELYRRSVA